MSVPATFENSQLRFPIPDEDFDKVLSILDKEEPGGGSVFSNVVKLTEDQAKRFIDFVIDKTEKEDNYALFSIYVTPFFDSFLNEEVYHYYIEEILARLKQLILDRIQFAFYLPPLAYSEMDEKEYENSFFEKEDIRFLDSLADSPKAIGYVISALSLSSSRGTHSPRKITERMSVFMYNKSIGALTNDWDSSNLLLSEYELPLPGVSTQKEDV